MRTQHLTFPESAATRRGLAKGPASAMVPVISGRRLVPATRFLGMIALILLAGALSSAAFGANPLDHNCRLHSSELNAGKGQMVFHLFIPCGLDPKRLEAELRAKLPQLADAKIDIQAV